MASPGRASRPRAPRPARHPFRQFLLVSGLAGVILAGMMLPLAGGVALGARDAAQSFESLPTVLETPPLPQRSVIQAADGSLVAEFYAQNRISVPLIGISKSMQQAIIAIEDARFYEHAGVDVRGTLRALRSNTSSGGVTQGGSTITQQYVKTTLVENAKTPEEREAARERSITRKVREARLAVALEQRYTKDEILERYLNTVYFGEGAYGVQAAAQRFFGVDAIRLNATQAATLAAIVQQPVGLSPIKSPKKAEARRNLVLARMAEQGMITRDQAIARAKTPIGKTLKVTEVRNGCASSYAPFFCDYVIRTIQNDEAFGKTREDRDALLSRGGLTIKTGLDPKLQRAAQEAVDSNIPRTDSSRKAAAVSVVEPGTGIVKAMAQNRSWGTKGRGFTTINFNVDTETGGSLGAQPGSTFKVFVLAAALDEGIPITTSISSPSRKTFYGFKDCKNGRFFEPYPVSNSTGSGFYSMRRATADSVNTYFVELEKRTGLCRPQEIASAFGVTRATGENLKAIPSFVLGSQPVSPLAMAEAYAAFAARGVHCRAVPFTAIDDRNGKPIRVPSANCQQRIRPAIADAVNGLLTSVMTEGTGKKLQIGRPVAGKTGTTNENAAVWFIGHTPQLATAVWIGDPRGGQQFPIRDVVINGRFITKGFGGLLAGPIWQSVMKAGMKGLPVEDFSTPDPSVIAGLPTEVPDITGLQPADAIARIEAAGLTPQVAEYRVPSFQPENAVVYTSPRAGRQVSSGADVTLFLSDGVPPPPPPPPPVTVPPTVVVVPTPQPTLRIP
jgi:membrane peptidoglycan carboxypeptidase